MKYRMVSLLFLLVAFISGFFAILTFKTGSQGGLTEGFTTDDSLSDNSCPNLLIQRGNSLLLYNTRKPEDEHNPIPFFNLDEYIVYVEEQRKKGIDCPVLFLQQENSAQGQDVYRMRPSPFDLQGGLPVMNNTVDRRHPTMYIDATMENPPYNANGYPGFDPHNQYEGIYTNLDVVHDSTRTKAISDNPMDPNWAGIQFTQQMIDSGKYEENNITNPVLFRTNNTVFNPNIPAPMAQPVDVL